MISINESSNDNVLKGAMIYAYNSGIVHLKNDIGNRIETDYDSDGWHIYQFFGEDQMKSQSDVEPITIERDNYSELLEKIKFYIEIGYTPEVDDDYINQQLEGWNNEIFPLH